MLIGACERSMCAERDGSVGAVRDRSSGSSSVVSAPRRPVPFTTTTVAQRSLSPPKSPHVAQKYMAKPRVVTADYNGGSAPTLEGNADDITSKGWRIGEGCGGGFHQVNFGIVYRCRLRLRKLASIFVRVAQDRDAELTQSTARALRWLGFSYCSSGGGEGKRGVQEPAAGARTRSLLSIHWSIWVFLVLLVCPSLLVGFKVSFVNPVGPISQVKSDSRIIGNLIGGEHGLHGGVAFNQRGSRRHGPFIAPEDNPWGDIAPHHRIALVTASYYHIVDGVALSLNHLVDYLVSQVCRLIVDGRCAFPESLHDEN